MILRACWASSTDWSLNSLPQRSRLWRSKYASDVPEIELGAVGAELPILLDARSFRRSALSMRPDLAGCRGRAPNRRRRPGRAGGPW